MNIVLGSSSPRRKLIVGGLIGGFRIAHPSIDETPLPGEPPETFATRIAEEKCGAVIESCGAGDFPLLVITADTIVTIDGHVIGKPDDFDDAVAMISTLNGRTHRVITALTLLAAEGPDGPRRILTRYESTGVTFKKLDREGIARYLNTIDYRDKAGSYAFQEQGGLIVEGFQGSATNIIGFPLRLFFSMLFELGILGAVFA
jgi:septum formation protein